jgi:hypothetical protein
MRHELNRLKSGKAEILSAASDPTAQMKGGHLELVAGLEHRIQQVQEELAELEEQRAKMGSLE